MKWRVIIDVELKRQLGSSLKKEIIKALKKCGIAQVPGTRIWEGKKVTPSEAVQQLSAVLGYLANPKSIANPKRARFDHLWVYIDSE